MNLNNKIAFAVTLAAASLTAHAQDKGMDIGFRPTKAAPTVSVPAGPAPVVASTAPVAQPARPAATPAVPVQQAVAPVKQAMPSVEKKQGTPQAVPVAAVAPKRVVPLTPAAILADVQPTQMAPASRPSPAQAAPVQPAVEGDINPFTGRDLSAEQRQRQLESAKMDTDLIQEKLKQANLIAELTYLPLKKRAEVAALPGMASATNPAPPPAPKATSEGGAPEATRPVRKAVKKSSAPKAVAPVAAPVISAPAAPTISVSGISINGTKASAIVEADGGVMSVQHGENTPFGQLRVVDSRTITLGGRTYQVRDAMLSRMTVSDPVYVDPEKVRVNTPAPTQAAVPLLTLPPLPPLPQLPQPPKGMTASMAPTPTR